MSYVRNEWKENDIITAEKLNNLEEGCDDIFDLGVVDITFPTEENPSVDIEGNLTEEQVEKLWDTKKIKISTINSGLTTSFILNLFQEQLNSSLQAKLKNYSFTSIQSNLTSHSIMAMYCAVVLSFDESSLQSHYILKLSGIEISN